MSFEVHEKFFKNLMSKKDKGTEYTFRGDFEVLLNEIKSDDKIKIIQEAKKYEEGKGKPDFKIIKNDLIIGYIETKNLTVNLSEIIDKDNQSRDAVQFRKYLELTNNLILTNYKDYMLFKNGNNKPVSPEITLFTFSDKTLDDANIQKVDDLFEGFFLTEPEKIENSQKLSILLANRTKIFKKYLEEEIKRDDNYTFKDRLVGEMGLYDLMKKTLIEDLSLNEFLDAYVTTITYGLFIAKLNLSDKKVVTLDKNNVIDYIPTYMGIIEELFETIKIETIPDSVNWVIEEIINILNNTDISQIKSNLKFSNYYHYEDPYVYFYENFLSEYDKEKRKGMGVYYTPIPVVRFIINNINSLLKKDFNTQGLVDPNINVLDFATGTGTFLLEAFKLAIDNTDVGLRNNLISDHLLCNYFGFEYLIVPYTVAHLKLSNYLKEVGYVLNNEERLGVFLTDTLDDKRHETWKLFPKISKESEHSQKIKIEEPIMVVIGNPPYNVKSRNNKEWIKSLCSLYKENLEEKNIQPLNDDYVKFIRYAHWKINNNKRGIIGIITNNSYINGLIFRIMRNKIYNDFNKIYILNLHGNKDKGEPDENVFDITQGVSIVLFEKNDKLKEKEVFYYSTLSNNIMSRVEKYEFLLKNNLESINWIKLKPESPNYWFIPFDETYLEEYKKGWSIKDIFKEDISGVKTAKDEFFIDFDKNELLKRVKDSLISEDGKAIEKKYSLSTTSGWNFAKFRRCKFDENKIINYLYRPFDIRWVYYDPNALSRARFDIMQNFIRYTNIGLITVRQFVEDIIFNHVFVTDKIVDIRITLSNRGTAFVFPLYVPKNDSSQRKLFDANNNFENPYSKYDPSPNFTDNFIKFFIEKYKTIISPEEIFSYIYAILHSPIYREIYNNFLKTDYPRILFVDEFDKLKSISELGCKLIDNHLLKIDYTRSNIGNFEISGDNLIIKHLIRYNEEEKRIYINSEQYYSNVLKNVWDFEIGHYKVIKKWIEEREGRKLNYEDISKLKSIINSINETINIMEKIDNILY